MALSDDFPTGTGVRLWTLGHAHHPIERFLMLLGSQKIEAVVDVRSRPGTKWAEQYGRRALERALGEAGVDYVWRGDALGGIPDDSRFYDAEGHTLYGRLSGESWFMKAIAWLEFEAGRRRLALICLEEEPERCHRHVLLARVLSERGAEVVHIRRNGSVETSKQVELRLGRRQPSLFEATATDVWRSPAPMRRS